MKKLTLVFDDDFHWEIIGISCQLADYKLVFKINKELKTAFKRVEDFKTQAGKSNKAYSLYVFNDESNQLSFYLLSNKSENLHLVSEYSRLDYFLIVEGEPEDKFLKEISKKLKAIPEVLFTQIIDTSTIKNFSQLSEDFELHIDSLGVF